VATDWVSEVGIQHQHLALGIEISGFLAEGFYRRNRLWCLLLGEPVHNHTGPSAQSGF
jgi:hypothetical protein